MKVYLVGGAVRDQLLGIKIKEKDWVVVGATQHDMLSKGYKQVGKDFPVFLHPKTKDEYALARKERKVGKGYTGFEFNTDISVTLEEDLKRRDITINAIAKSESGELIDPYNGKKDLESKILRHVSSAFVEDPVRILRIARFAARFGFDIAKETNILMHDMVKNNEVNALIPERVWKEFKKSLSEKYPEKFFYTLEECDALHILFPKIEIKNKNIKLLNNMPNKATFRFAALLSNLNYDDAKNLCYKIKAPNDFKDIALLTNKYLSNYITAKTTDDLIKLFQNTDAFRREKRFTNFLNICNYLKPDSNNKIHEIYKKIKNVDISDIIEKHKGKDIGEKIIERRTKEINKFTQN
ncbi:multifunctional CCA tRNA nucleotidyl transferase/2'3'-cyclic phosphodiesterase/2'nucleotidase/phosphatase [Gammaproteobacteria bacterium]|nr:multifunctional CCA tRNA nucleotidyl transferase/2'3'-cyclic phosphodiesterase/2'nucleotidase/phosphatase [Gammaproteobacteria bacterium]